MPIYVIGTHDGAKKVGFSMDLEKRITQLQAGNPEPLILFHYRDVQHSYGQEAENVAHSLLATKRVRGEWFDVAVDEALSAIDEAVASVERGQRLKRSSPRYDKYKGPFLTQIPEELVTGLDQVLDPGQTRAGFIREAVAREIEHRQLLKKKDGK